MHGGFVHDQLSVLCKRIHKESLGEIIRMKYLQSGNRITMISQQQRKQGENDVLYEQHRTPTVYCICVIHTGFPFPTEQCLYR